MKIQKDWLQQYVDCSLPTPELGHLLTMAGLEIEAFEKIPLEGGGLTDVLELNVTPNRGYCLSHLGVAREVAALTESTLKLLNPEKSLKESKRGSAIEEKLAVHLDDPELCPRYAAMVIENVKVKPSPQWLQDRLTAVGLRPINNVVDITNFVLMEYGQPLHAFDLSLLKKNEIIVRRANDKEVIETLDGSQLTLEPDTLVIADGVRPVALAGVMGGANSQVTETTESIVLESACFNPSSIRKTSKKYGLRSDSSYRFERGIDIDSVISAQARAALLIEELAGGTIAQGEIDLYPSPRPAVKLVFRVGRCNAILGTSLKTNTVKKYLEALDMKIEKAENDQFELMVPASRPMIEREIDLIEEVARLHGYDQIEITDPSGRLNPLKPTDLQKTSQALKQLMCNMGFTETINYSFLEKNITEHFIDAFGNDGATTISLDNPISVDLGTMRTSLMPGLVKSSVRNIRHGAKSLRLFELGAAFFQKDDQVVERPCLAAIITGPYPADVWTETGKGYDFYDIKGTLESLLSHFGINGEYQLTTKSYLKQDTSIDCLVGETSIASLGELSASTAKKFELDQSLFAFEIDLEGWVNALPSTVRFEPLPRFPGIFRDISLLVDKSVSSGEVRKVIEQAGPPLLKQTELYDHFEGKKLEPGKKSLTFALTFQSPDRTLTDEEVNPVFEKIVEQLVEKVQAHLRDA